CSPSRTRRSSCRPPIASTAWPTARSARSGRRREPPSAQVSMADPARWLRRRGRRLLFHSLRLLARAGGFARAAALGRLAGELEYRVAWRRRRRCLHDTALALGREPGDPWVAARLRRAHHVNGRAVLEIL